MTEHIINKIINKMMDQSIIPSTGPFDITEEIILSYMKLYSLYKTNNIDLAGILDYGNYKYARKLAGINLLKHKVKSGISSSNIKEGIVYSISNPAWDRHTKIGMTVDLKKRLKSYQTYSPFRDFKVNTYEFVLDRKLVERDIIKQFSYSLEQGEWLKDIETTSVIEYIKNNWVSYGPVAQ